MVVNIDVWFGCKYFFCDNRALYGEKLFYRVYGARQAPCASMASAADGDAWWVPFSAIIVSVRIRCVLIDWSTHKLSAHITKVWYSIFVCFCYYVISFAKHACYMHESRHAHKVNKIINIRFCKQPQMVVLCKAIPWNRYEMNLKFNYPVGTAPTTRAWRSVVCHMKTTINSAAIKSRSRFNLPFNFTHTKPPPITSHHIKPKCTTNQHEVSVKTFNLSAKKKKNIQPFDERVNGYWHVDLCLPETLHAHTRAPYMSFKTAR